MDAESPLPASIRALPVTGDVIKAHRLTATDCEVLFVAAPGGAQMAMHDHDTQNATVIVSGEMVLVTEQGESRVGPGDWYQTAPGERHAIRFPSDTLQIEFRFRQDATRSRSRGVDA
jgi:quercetin dioxygenase-like cupin family protein